MGLLEPTFPARQAVHVTRVFAAATPTLKLAAGPAQGPLGGDRGLGNQRRATASEASSPKRGDKAECSPDPSTSDARKIQENSSAFLKVDRRTVWLGDQSVRPAAQQAALAHLAGVDGRNSQRGQGKGRKDPACQGPPLGGDEGPRPVVNGITPREHTPTMVVVGQEGGPILAQQIPGRAGWAAWTPDQDCREQQAHPQEGPAPPLGWAGEPRPEVGSTTPRECAPSKGTRGREEDPTPAQQTPNRAGWPSPTPAPGHIHPLQAHPRGQEAAQAHTPGGPHQGGGSGGSEAAECPRRVQDTLESNQLHQEREKLWDNGNS